MANWVPIAVNVGVGGAVGAADQMLQNQDEKRRRAAESAGKKFGRWQEYGTYYNYGLPILSVFATALGFLKGAWADRAVLAGSQLAGRKVTYAMTKATQATPWRPAPDTRPPVPQTQKPGFEKSGIV